MSLEVSQQQSTSGLEQISTSDGKEHLFFEIVKSIMHF